MKQIIDTYIKNRTKIPDILLELKSIKIKNFKKITTATIDLKNELNIIVGMNNAGKSSFIQGILLAYQALFTLLKENRIRFRKNGSINLQHDLFPSARIDKFPFLLGSPLIYLIRTQKIVYQRESNCLNLYFKTIYLFLSVGV